MTHTPQSTIDRSEMFDTSLGYDDEAGVRLPSNLSEEERKRATFYYRLFNELWGLCIVVGDPGKGKDVFGNYMVWTLKKYFPFKRIVRDEKPRPLFGEYDAVFDENVIVNDLKNMALIAKKGKKKIDIEDEEESEENAAKYSDKIVLAAGKCADDWVKGAGEVLLKNSICYLTEYWRYVYNRESGKPINKTMGAIHKTGRHLDLLVFGTVQIVSDLDPRTCLPFVNWRVTCNRSVANTTGFFYHVQKVKWDKREMVLVPIGQPVQILVDAGKPRSDMGDGKIIIKRPDYIPQTEEERIVLDVLKVGINNYEQLVGYIDTYGDMTESEVLATLKELKFRKNKRVIDYPCVFGLYNSKSAVSIKTSLKVVD